MIFDDSFIKQGAAGGNEAAARLWTALHVQVEALDLPSDVKVVTRVYANLKGLGDACAKAGIIARPDIIEEFARGFTGSKQLFDFVDVGAGKDRADDKISGVYPPPFAGVIVSMLIAHQKSLNYIFMTVIVVTSFSAAPTTMGMRDCWRTWPSHQS